MKHWAQHILYKHNTTKFKYNIVCNFYCLANTLRTSIILCSCFTLIYERTFYLQVHYIVHPFTTHLEHAPLWLTSTWALLLQTHCGNPSSIWTLHLVARSRSCGNLILHFLVCGLTFKLIIMVLPITEYVLVQDGVWMKCQDEGWQVAQASNPYGSCFQSCFIPSWPYDLYLYFIRSHVPSYIAVCCHI